MPFSLCTHVYCYLGIDYIELCVIVVSMYIETVPNRSSPPAILLREARREGKKIVKRTLANLSHWPGEQVEAFRLLLRGERLVPAGELFRVERTLLHGHVEAILRMIEKIVARNGDSP